MNSQETELGSHIMWPQLKTSTVHPYLLCPHGLKCQTAFVVPKEVCHLEIGHKRNCAAHRSCCIRYALAYLPYWRTRMSWWIQDSLLCSKSPASQSLHSVLFYSNWYMQTLSGIHSRSLKKRFGLTKKTPLAP